MKAPTYYIAKARLSGVFSRFPAGLALVLAAVIVILFAQDNLTPFSVFVHGYTRSDGTRVSSYYRRPPGSVPHDRPYEQLRLAGVVVLVIGGYVSGKPLWLFFRARPETLLPALDNVPVPPSPPERVQNPKQTAKARRNCSCQECGCIIPKGTTYYYVEAARARGPRSRYCGTCAARLSARTKLYQQQQKEFEAAMAQYRTVVGQLKRQQFISVYGYDGETPQSHRQSHRMGPTRR